MTQTDRSGPTSAGGQLGTFAGVFTPSVLTILGIILFLRLGFVAGNAGLARALIIIGLANLISVLTSVSLSAVATNLKVKGGGDYYLISRTLGPAFGGALGLVLFMAQAVSIAFYCIGFAEALIDILPAGAPVPARIVAYLAVGFLFVLAWLGADAATKFQYGVMALLAAALVSFFAGGLVRFDAANLAANWAAPADGLPFWVLFAIFFPAVTGFTQGVSMSGDLKDPGRSLPLGTFMAVGISILVYFGVALVFAGVLSNADLARDYKAMKKVARVPALIDAGVIAATLSSAMASFLGAPRILQSLAGDRIFPWLVPFAKGAGAANNPRRGILLSGAIALGVITLGNLNLVASVVSMFFLISYGLLNYATYYEARAASPSFRPRFKWFDQRLSLAGTITCFGAMLAIDLATGVVAIAIIFAVYQYIQRTAGPARWADSRRAAFLQSVRTNLLAAWAEPEHPRDWRPQILAFSSDPERRSRLLHLAAWVEGRSGMTTVVKILEGTGLKWLRQRAAEETELRQSIVQAGFQAFARVITTRDMDSGLYHLIQAYGIGPLRSNIVLLNWLDPQSASGWGFRELLFGRQLRPAFRMGCNIVVLHSDEGRWQTLRETPAEKSRIDVWWTDDATGRLMLLLAYLLTRSQWWDKATIRLVAGGYGEDSANNRETLQTVLDEARIEAEVVIVADPSPETLFAHCGDATLVLLPFRLRGNLIEGPLPGRVEECLQKLPTTALVLAAEDIDLDAEPEEGAAGEMAAARDTAAAAEQKAREAEKAAARAQIEAEGLRAKLTEGQGAAEEPEAVDASTQSLRDAAAEAEAVAIKAMRRAAKARAKADDAAATGTERGQATSTKKET